MHIVNTNYTGLGTGMTVGQAWLLDDVISLVSFLPLFLVLEDSWCLIADRLTKDQA